jgi:hypothetical protein
MENNYKEIEYKNEKVQVLQYLSESNNQFNQKLEFIKKMEKKNIEWKDANKYSKIWHCIKFKQCKYPPEIYYKIINLDN